MENQMIKVIQRSNGKVAVSGRDLYRFLEIKSKFADWIKRMISEYGFVKNVDYTVYLKNEKNQLGGRPSKDYVFTLDTAKEICMVQRNSLGRLARHYFIGVQKRYQNRIKLPRTPQQVTHWLAMNTDHLNRVTTQNTKDISGLKKTVNNTMRVTSTEQYQLKNVEHRVVIKQLGGYNSTAYQKYSSKGFRQCWRDFKNHFNLPRYSDLPHGEFNAGLSFLNSWHLHGELLTYAHLANEQITLGE